MVTLGTDEAAAHSSRQISVSRQCGVFFASEVITYVNNGEALRDIAGGLCDAAARIVTFLARRFGIGNRYIVTGEAASTREVIELACSHIGGDYQDPALYASHRSCWRRTPGGS